MQPWSPITLTSRASATGNLTALFPETCTAGTGLSTSGTWRRQQTEGVLYSADVFPTSVDGGTIEIWDVAGLDEGGSNNTDTGTTLTDAYLQAQKAKGKARLIWTQGFKGDTGTSNKLFKQRVPIMWGLAARFINTAIAESAGTCIVSIVASGGFRKIQITG